MKAFAIALTLFSLNASASVYLSVSECVTNEGEQVNLLLSEQTLCNKGNTGLIVLSSDTISAIGVTVSKAGSDIIAKDETGSISVMISGNKGEVRYNDTSKEEVIPLACNSIIFSMDC